MIALRRVAAATLLAGGLALAPASAALAQEACESYSGGCAPTQQQVGGGEQAPAQLGGGEQAPAQGGGGASPRTLPFTGAELVLASALGVGAVAVGAGFVVAGRRRVAPSL